MKTKQSTELTANSSDKKLALKSNLVYTKIKMEDFWINCMIRTDNPRHITIIQKQAILTA